MHPDFSHWSPCFFGEGCSGICVGLGASAQCDVLVHPRCLGDEPVGVVAGAHGMAGTYARGSGGPATLGRVWIALGHRRVEQHFSAFVSARMWNLGMVSTAENWQAISRWSGPGLGSLLRLQDRKSVV